MSPPLQPVSWPQDQLQIPNADGRYMPPVDRGNFDVVRQESFLMSHTFTFTSPVAAGTRQTMILPTDQDGDFWCSQMFATMWSSQTSLNLEVVPARFEIQDIRTGRSINYPDGVPSLFFSNQGRFNADIAAVGDRPLPDGFRPTATLPQPFCFTRQGGIRLTIQLIFAITNAPGTVRLIDFTFGGWKEFAYASRGQAPKVTANGS